MKQRGQFATWLRNRFTFRESEPAPPGREAVWYVCTVCRGWHWIGQPPKRPEPGSAAQLFRNFVPITRAGPRCRRLAQREVRT